MLKLPDKQRIVEQIAEVARRSVSAVGALNHGLTVSEMTELRAQARGQGVFLKVVRNTLVRRAVENTEFDCLSSYLVGPVILGFSADDPGSPARLFKAFGKAHEKFAIHMFAVGGKAYPGSDIDKLASLPTREQALSQLLSVMQAPVSKLVRTIAEPHTKMVRTVAAVLEKRRAESEAA